LLPAQSKTDTESCSSTFIQDQANSINDTGEVEREEVEREKRGKEKKEKEKGEERDENYVKHRLFVVPDQVLPVC